MPKPLKLASERLETDIQKSILAYLSLFGFFWKARTTGLWDAKRKIFRTSMMKGVSDIVGVLRGGRFMSVEVKRPGHEPTPHQILFMQRVRAAGGIAIVASSVENVSHILQQLRGMKEIP
jgi:hypothetical protein